MPVPTSTELQDFIDDALGAKLKGMENVERRRRRRTRALATILLIILIPTGVIATLTFGLDPQISLLEYPLKTLAAFLVIYLPYYLWTNLRSRHFTYREDVLSSLIYFLDPRLSYRPDEPLPRPLFEESTISPTSLRLYKSADLATGTLREFELQFATVVARQHRWRSTSGYAFDGLFLHARLPKPFEPTTLLPSPTDKTSVPLPQNVQERLLEAEQNWQKEIPDSSSHPLVMKLRDEHLYLAIPIPDLFDAGPPLQLGDTEKLYRFARVLSEAIDLLEKLASL